MEGNTRLSRVPQSDCFVSRGNRQNIMKMCSTIDVPADRQAACIVGLSGSLSDCLSIYLFHCLSISLSLCLSLCLSVWHSFLCSSLVLHVAAVDFSLFFHLFLLVPCQSRLVKTHFHLPLKIDQHFDGLNVKRLLESTDSQRAAVRGQTMPAA